MYFHQIVSEANFEKEWSEIDRYHTPLHIMFAPCPDEESKNIFPSLKKAESSFIFPIDNARSEQVLILFLLHIYYYCLSGERHVSVVGENSKMSLTRRGAKQPTSRRRPG
jgi:hypothetical protein